MDVPAPARGFPAELLRERGRALGRITAEIRHHFSLPTAEGEAGGWSLDLFPRVLDVSEWRVLRDGMVQRMRAFSRLTADLHGDRRIVRDGILPAEVLLAIPGYYRELLGPGGPRNRGFLLGAVDLFPARDGRWRVFENHFSFPAGISHAIQNRRMLAQGFPEIFEEHQVAPVAGFGSDLVEALRGEGPADGGRIVLLTRGDTVRPHFDDSFLARHMGIVSVRPADLVVRDGRVFLKTVDGLERVEVILRKVETNAVDPITFVENADRGVPGLVHCLRRGTVRVENVPGAEVADDRSLLPFSDAIIRYYTGEAPLLGTVETYHCFDRDQAEWVAERRDEFLFDYVATPRVMLSAVPVGSSGAASPGGPLLSGPPEWTVARRIPESVESACWDEAGTSRAPFFLRLFGVLRPRPIVLPGGLTWRAAESGSVDFIGGMKDTWVIDESLGRTGRGSRSSLERDLAPANLPAPSRVAEGIYWMARYLERARDAAHQAGLLESIRWTELAPADEGYYWPLWRGVAAAAHFEPLAREAEMPDDFPALFRDFVGARGNPSSVASCLEAARTNLDRIQEWVTPEMAEVFFQWNDAFAEALRDADDARGSAARGACLVVSREHARFVGTLERTLAHDATYSFWTIGSSLERAIGTTLLLEAIIPSRISLQERHLEDDTDLTALLRLLGCLDAYRREYRSRAYLDRVVRLIWRKGGLPGSFLFDLSRIRDSLRSLGKETVRHSNEALRRRVGRMIRRVEDFPIEEVFPARATHLDFGEGSTSVHEETLRKVVAELRWLRKGFLDLHGELEDRYFSHQG
mgnify:CR=1 FL=1